MVSDVEKAKRAFIVVIRSLSVLYNCCFDISRDSADTAITKAYRALSRKVHPDKGGRAGDQTRLNAAHDVWVDALKNRAARGRPQGAKGNSAEAAGPQPGLSSVDSNGNAAGFRIQSAAVLLTYQGVLDVAQWCRFVAFVTDHLRAWRVRYWTATLETNADERLHLYSAGSGGAGCTAMPTAAAAAPQPHAKPEPEPQPKPQPQPDTAEQQPQPHPQPLVQPAAPPQTPQRPTAAAVFDALMLAARCTK